MRMWRKPLVTAYQSRAFRKRHAVPFSAAFQQPAAHPRLCDPGSNGPPSAHTSRMTGAPGGGRNGEAARRANRRRRSSGAPPHQSRPFPIRGDTGKQENERKGEDGRGHRPQTCPDRMRHHGRRVGGARAVLQAVGPFPTPNLHGMPTGASRSTGFMLAMAPLLAASGFTIHLRCSDALIARYLKANAALCIAWLLIVTLKYPTGNDHLVPCGTHYALISLTSTFSLFSAMRASALDRMPVTSYAKRAVLAIDAALIALVLTNNLHHVVFRFSFDDPLWSGSYTYGPGYWVVLGWIITQIALFFACSFAAARRQLRSASVPSALIVGVLGTYTVLYILRFLIGSNLALVYSILLISCLEIALDLGILPSYYWRESMFSALPFNLRILSRTGEVALHTALFQPSAHDDALHSMLLQSDLSRRSISSFRTTAVPHTLFRGYNVTGGSALLAEDVTAIDNRRETLEQQQDSLRAHNELLQHRHAIDGVLYRTQQERALTDDRDACCEDPTHRRSALRPPPRKRPAKPGEAARAAHRGQVAHRILQAQGRPGTGWEKRPGVQPRTPSAGVQRNGRRPAQPGHRLRRARGRQARAAGLHGKRALRLPLRFRGGGVRGKQSHPHAIRQRQGRRRRRVGRRGGRGPAPPRRGDARRPRGRGVGADRGYTRSLEELRRILERRNVRFALDIAPDGATLAVQVSEGEGVA